MRRGPRPTTFWIFDTFGSEEARQAHVNGEIAAALMANADELLARRRRSCRPTCSPRNRRLAPGSRRTDWVAWHRDYADPESALSGRLEEVREQIRRALPDAPARVLSICAGQGDDLLTVVRDHRAPVTGRLVELDSHNAAELRARVAAGRPYARRRAG